MKRRLYIKFFVVAIKCLFWISLIYGILLLTKLPSADEDFTEDIKDSAAEKLPSKLLSQADFKHAIADKTAVKIADTTAVKIADTTAVKIADKTSHKMCDGMPFPSFLASKDTWQPVDKSKSMYMFSAYYVEQRKTVVVIGVRPRRDVSVKCQFWKTRGNTTEMVGKAEAEVRALLDDFGFRFATTMFECSVHSSPTPTYVSLVSKPCDNPTNMLEVQKVLKPVLYKPNLLTVCIPPFVNSYDKTADFVKWVEINREFGVHKFVAYNHSSGPNVDRVLHHYLVHGVMEVIQWNPPMVDEDFSKEIRAVETEKYGQTAALNDCLYRSKQSSELITNIGINEYIVPRNKSTIFGMLLSLGINASVYHIRLGGIESAPKEEKPVKTEVQKTKPDVEKPKAVAQKLDVDKPKPSVQKQKTEPSKVKPSPLIIRTDNVNFSSLHHVPDVDNYVVPADKAVMHKHQTVGRNLTTELASNGSGIFPREILKSANKYVEQAWSILYGVDIK